jgi:hypothetical protein
MILAGQHVTQRPTRRNWAKRGQAIMPDIWTGTRSPFDKGMQPQTYGRADVGTKKRWRYHTEGDHLHVWPIKDLIKHDTDDDDAGCMCGPRTEPVKSEDGSVGWLIVHHSLDGRERNERDAKG